MIRQLVYTSRAASSVTLRDVYDIIRTAHNRNSTAGITGGLLFIDGYFIQLLEGLPSSVDERFGRIETDSRHQDVQVRTDRMVETALFETEWMALRDGTRVESSILEAHAYEVGLPESRFSGDEVLNFLLACFDGERAALA
ncbi:MAG: BLUF domain-containing protein [Planctomycetota bacterium]